MSETTIYTCDRCGARHEGRLPLGWQKSVRIVLDAEDLPTYSPLRINDTHAHLCQECIGHIAIAMHAAIAPAPQTPLTPSPGAEARQP